MQWRPEPDRSEPVDPWLISGTHDQNELDPDEQPTLIRARREAAQQVKACLNPHCCALIWRLGPDLCSPCRELRYRVSELRNRVHAGQLTDFPMGTNHRAALFHWKPIQPWQRSLRTIVVNACYQLRYWPWREPHFRGYDGALGAA